MLLKIQIIHTATYTSKVLSTNYFNKIVTHNYTSNSLHKSIFIPYKFY